MGAALHALERRRVARINFDGAHGVRFTRVFGTSLPAGPRGPNPANEINPSIDLFGQRNSALTGPDAELFVLHAVLHSDGVRGVIPRISTNYLHKDIFMSIYRRGLRSWPTGLGEIPQ